MGKNGSDTACTVKHPLRTLVWRSASLCSMGGGGRPFGRRNCSGNFFGGGSQNRGTGGGGTSGAVADPDGKIQGAHVLREQARQRAKNTVLEESLAAPDQLGQWEDREYAGQLWEKAAALLSPEEVALLRMWHWKSWGTRRRQSDWGSRCGPARNECSVFEKSCGPRGESWKGGHHETVGGDHAGIVPGGIGADASE